MRPDVKLGVVISTVFVLVAGGYFIFRDKRQRPVPIAAGQEGLSAPVAAAEQPGSTLADSGQRPSPRRSQPARADSPRSGEKRRPRPAGPRTTPSKARTAAAGEGPVPAQAGRSGEDPGGEAMASLPLPSRHARKPAVSTTPSRPPVSLVAAKSGDTPGAVGSEANKGQVAVDTHQVQPGDTFSSLAERYYGSANFTQFLVESNPQVAEPHRLRVGAIVKIPLQPSEDALPGSGPAKSAGGERRTYQVQPGDSFYVIARDVLGDASRWKELFALNKELVHGDPKRLQVGQIVVLPNP